jgi:hypothetical protein
MCLNVTIPLRFKEADAHVMDMSGGVKTLGGKKGTAKRRVQPSPWLTRSYFMFMTAILVTYDKIRKVPSHAFCSIL